MKKEEVDYLIRHYLYLLPLEIKHTFKYPYLNEVEMQKERIKLSKLILEKHKEKIFWNLCPKCRELARTPKAKQCRFCNHDWR